MALAPVSEADTQDLLQNGAPLTCFRLSHRVRAALMRPSVAAGIGNNPQPIQLHVVEDGGPVVLEHVARKFPGQIDAETLRRLCGILFGHW